MKAIKLYTQIILLYLGSITVSNAQIGINATGMPPHASAMLDVSSTKYHKGFHATTYDLCTTHRHISHNNKQWINGI
jgi:hypothetical protein